MFRDHQTLDTVSYRGLRCFVFVLLGSVGLHIPLKHLKLFQISFIYQNILIITLGSTYYLVCFRGTECSGNFYLHLKGCGNENMKSRGRRQIV